MGSTSASRIGASCGRSPNGGGRKKTIRTDLAVLFVGDEAEREALLLGEPDLFMPVPGFGQRPFVAVRLASVTVARLQELISDAIAKIRRTVEREADSNSIRMIRRRCRRQALEVDLDHRRGRPDGGLGVDDGLAEDPDTNRRHCDRA